MKESPQSCFAMKRPRFSSTLYGLAALAAFGGQDLRAQGTAFMYQGRLNNGGTAANGSYDFRFASPAADISRALCHFCLFSQQFARHGGCRATERPLNTGTITGSSSDQ